MDDPVKVRRVLVVEDEYFIADDVMRALREVGIEVVGPVPDRDTALALLDKYAVDGAVLDINLRGELAYPIADILLARGIPLMFATGYDPSTVPSRFRDVPCWSKPFDVHRLANQLAAMVA